MATNPGTTNLVAWWSLDEFSGQRNDLHDNAYHLTNNNTVTQAAAGKVGNAAQFTNANDEYLSRASNADLSPGDADFSIGGWFYMDSQSTTYWLFGKWDSFDSNKEYVAEYETAPDKIVFYVSSDGSSNSANVQHDTFGTLATGTWYFVVCYHDATANEIGISVNGSAFDTTAHSGGVHQDVEDFNLGAAFALTTNCWDGRMDEWFFFSEVLTSDDVDWLYNSGNGRQYDDLITGGAAAAGGGLKIAGSGGLAG